MSTARPQPTDPHSSQWTHINALESVNHQPVHRNRATLYLTFGSCPRRVEDGSQGVNVSSRSFISYGVFSSVSSWSGKRWLMLVMERLARPGGRNWGHHMMSDWDFHLHQVGPRAGSFLFYIFYLHGTSPPRTHLKMKEIIAGEKE